MVVDDTTGCEPILGCLTPDLLPENGLGMSMASLFCRARDDRLEEDGMLMGPFLAGGEAEDGGEDSLAHVSPGAPDLIGTQFRP